MQHVRPVVFLYGDVVAHNPTVPGLVSAYRRLPADVIQSYDVTAMSVDEVETVVRGARLVVVEATVIGARFMSDLFPHYLRFVRPRNSEFFTRVVELILESPADRVLLAADYDLHGRLGGDLSADELSRFCALVWAFVELPIDPELVWNTAYEDPWMQSSLSPRANWDFARECIPVQIEHTHALDAPRDFRARPRLRKWAACVPGALYATRAIATSSAETAGASIAPYRKADALAMAVSGGLTKFMGDHADSARFELRYRNQRFWVEHSASAWVDGSGYRYFVRKMLEVPALTTPMVATSMGLMHRLGFADGLNYIEALPEEYGEWALHLASDRQKAETLARNAFSLVARNHVWDVRVRDQASAFAAIADGHLDRWEFNDGRLRAVGP